MAEVLISLLITVIILAVIFGIVWAIIRLITPMLPAPFGQVITYIFYGLMAIALILYVLVPLIRMIPAVT